MWAERNIEVKNAAFSNKGLPWAVKLHGALRHAR